MKKYVDHSWDFSSANTKYLTHGVHSYPAMMIPQVARRLIAEHGKNAKQALDPFCGSGSVLLEFKLAGIDCFGVDINPLAVMVSQVKNRPLPPALLQKRWATITQKISEYSLDKYKPLIDFPNLSFWFKPQVIRDLTAIRRAIDIEKNMYVKEFFLVCFSETVRKASNTRGGEFKLYRIAEDKLKTHNPEAFKIFSKIVERNIAGMTSLYDFCSQKKTGSVKVIHFDVTEQTKIPAQSIDLVVTSPPYGDSRTTVAYGQFSRLSLQWLDLSEEKVRNLDKRMLGGKPASSCIFNFKSPTLEKIIKAVSKQDDLRAREVLSFYIDFHKAAVEINRLMRPKATICLVVGNRTVKGIKIPTDEIMAEIFEELGYSHRETIVRRIPSKKMPRRNSPTNVKGATISTMNEENLVILTR